MQNYIKTETRLAFIQFIFSSLFSDVSVEESTEEFENYFYKLSVSSIDQKKEKPINLKILDKSLHTKLVILPDLYFGEAYTNGSVVIENGTLTEFLDIAMKNIGKGDTGYQGD